MRKSLILAVIIAVIPCLALASNFDGAYVGGSLGNNSDHYSLTDTGLGGFAGTSFSNDAGAQGITEGLFAGYGKRFNNLYLGAEAQGDLYNDESNTTLTTGGNTFFIKLKHQYDYGAAIRAGIFPVDNTLLYGKVGVLWGRFEDEAVNTSQTLSGAQFGLGAETALNSTLTLRADWTYVDYQSASYSSSVQTGSASPASNTFRIGLAYNF